MKKLTIIDGGMGRELERIGAPFSQTMWSAQALLETPGYVRQAHQNFIDAGAQVIIANSSACVPFYLGQECYQAKGESLAREAAIIAQSVVQHEKVKHRNKVLAAGALSPPYGNDDPDLFDAESALGIYHALFAAQNRYVDLWFAEEIASIAELTLVQSVLQHAQQPCYYILSLSNETTPELQLRSGESAIDAIDFIVQHGGEGILFESETTDVISQAIARAAERIKRADIELGGYINFSTTTDSALTAQNTSTPSSELSPQSYLVLAQHWYQLGATLFGGCCGIRPEHIQALARWRDSQEPLVAVE
ncbi:MULTISPECIES: homocysteine S-methyltransferase family protein [Gammaproteobacteria]|uniref:homocysteine S-methyltransferase family protein n=1 Tax=Gammaproteobacteria TaxID=1236 RepID=UPI00249E5146|nr:homocysteine S-methyltransferase family protein [Vibrio sp. ABG19]WGY47931.1 homocysteine S-methyltransferase family protein [Vibrio sp. ABG19]